MKIIHRGLIVIIIILAGGVYVYMQNNTPYQKDQGETICTDSDGGKNIYVKGWAKESNSKRIIYVGEDTCAIPNDGPAKYTTGLPSCFGSNCYVNKNYCGLYRDTIFPQHKFVQCPHGCTDGACIK